MSLDFSDYFALFQIEKSFKIDRKYLREQYVQKQLDYHPDNSKLNLSQEQLLAISANLNKAYQILADDYLRVCYILELAGIDVQNQLKTQKLPPDELAQIWDNFAYLEENNNLEKLENFLNKIKQESNLLISNLEKKLPISKQEDIILDIMRLKYQDNLITKIQDKIAECGL